MSDQIAEGDHTGTISHLVTSADLKYSGLYPNGKDLVVNITDNDYADLIISQSDGSSAVAEGGATDDYTVALSSEPTFDVTVTVTSGDDLSTDPIQLTFTPDNWDQPQGVTVTAVDDSEIEETEFRQIDHVVTSLDSMYNGLAVSQIWVEITDNDKEIVNGTLNLFGSAGDDKLELIRGNVLTVKVNDQLVYEGTEVHTVTFDGLGGYDEVDVTGAAEFEQTVINPHDVSVNSSVFSFTAENIERALVESGGGDDRVIFNDSVGDDTFIGSPTEGNFSGDGFNHRADNFREVQVYAREGGYDKIELRDTHLDGDKAKIGSSKSKDNDTVKLYNPVNNDPAYYIRGKFFEEIVVTSLGGNDFGRSWDTPCGRYG